MLSVTYRTLPIADCISVARCLSLIIRCLELITKCPFARTSSQVADLQPVAALCLFRNTLPYRSLYLFSRPSPRVLYESPAHLFSRNLLPGAGHQLPVASRPSAAIYCSLLFPCDSCLAYRPLRIACCHCQYLLCIVPCRLSITCCASPISYRLSPIGHYLQSSACPPLPPGNHPSPSICCLSP